MPSAWLTIPSARPVDHVRGIVAEWHSMGYKVALHRDLEPVGADFEIIGDYPGYAVACNRLIASVMEIDRLANWFVCAGDDTTPDQTKHADEIAEECEAHFLRVHVDTRYPGLRESNWDGVVPVHPVCKTFAVMQPTGDDWGDRTGPYIKRVAGSPWLGREFCRRAYGGRGPMWPEFLHMHGDEHLRAIAVKLGIYWEREDLCHTHNHWGRVKRGQPMASNSAMPEFLRKWNTPQHWNESKAIFERLRRGGFAEALDLLP